MRQILAKPLQFLRKRTLENTEQFQTTHGDCCSFLRKHSIPYAKVCNLPLTICNVTQQCAPLLQGLSIRLERHSVLRRNLLQCAIQQPASGCWRASEKIEILRQENDLFTGPIPQNSFA